ncbi:MAG: RNA methyltransferase [Desulfuromonadales bacterium]|nr:RNA methyltransferase [Desulfuromonadales bacterium]
MNFDNLCVVLVAPSGALNIGSVARAMANFGVADLRLVAPQTDHLQDAARKMAVKATPVLEQATIHDDLASALQGCHFALGTTRRFGKYRENLLHPDEAAHSLLPLLGKGRVALVFGREDRGLKTEELDLCQRLITIPTSDQLPSMNLAQSVAVCLYEVAKVHGSGNVTGAGRKLATGAQLEDMFDHMRRSFREIGYLDPQNPEHILRAIRRFLGRAALDPREVRILRGLLSQIDWVEEERRRLAGEGNDDPVSD